MSNGSKKKLDWQKNIKGKNKGVEIENILMLLSCLQAGAQEAMFFRKKHGLFFLLPYVAKKEWRKSKWQTKQCVSFSL